MTLASFDNQERLKSKEEINHLFTNGKRIYEPPLVIIWDTTDSHDSFAKVAFSVPKKYLPKAVSRNRVKRLLRESYRTHKTHILTKLQSNRKGLKMLVIYTDSIVKSYVEIEAKISVTLQRLSRQV